MNYLLPDVDMYLMHIFNQLEDLLFLDFIIISFTHYIAAVFHTFYMLPGNTDKDFREENT